MRQFWQLACGLACALAIFEVCAAARRGSLEWHFDDLPPDASGDPYLPFGWTQGQIPATTGTGDPLTDIKWSVSGQSDLALRIDPQHPAFFNAYLESPLFHFTGATSTVSLHLQWGIALGTGTDYVTVDLVRHDQAQTTNLALSLDDTFNATVNTPVDPGVGTYSLRVNAGDYDSTPSFQGLHLDELVITNSALLATWQNPDLHLDVNDDGEITSLDALVIINRLNATGPEQLPTVNINPPPYYDVDGDGYVLAQDALSVINFLNAPQALMALGMNDPSAVPEPSSLALSALAAVGLLFAALRRRKSVR